MSLINGLPRKRAVGGWALLGLLGSLLAALAGPAAVADAHSPWWYSPAVPGGHGVAVACVYAGVALVSAAWLGLGRHAGGPDTGWLVVIALVWLAPIAVGPALFSRDVYSYIAQGTVLHAGLNPYQHAPADLQALGHGHVLAAVSPFWRHTTAPYGPLFLGLMSAIVTVTGRHLTAAILLLRAIELASVAWLARTVPRLAREHGADPGRALWLVALNPLLLFQLLAPAHNDVLMVALLAAGLASALGGRPILGVVLCALAATVKLPALAGAAFIVVAWAREEPGTRSRARLVLAGVLSAAAALAAVSVVTGLGFSWLSSTLFETPARVRLAITPATGFGYTLAALLHDVGVGVSARGLESACAAITTAAVGALGLVMLVRVRIRHLALLLGLLLLAAAAGGPAAWPWYFAWGLVPLAAVPAAGRSRALVIGSVVAAFVIKPGGILALPLPSAPAVISLYAALAGGYWLSRRGGRGPGRGLAARTPSALAGT